ncbi:hypothetical protein Q8F55_007103 [Vanrija albida]|uniref:Uncharacterized protein n=1 Tax=Vanrija albida TaxID=181172 RepID=A0ABR3PYU6_9TREE
MLALAPARALRTPLARALSTSPPRALGFSGTLPLTGALSTLVLYVRPPVVEARTDGFELPLDADAASSVLSTAYPPGEDAAARELRIPDFALTPDPVAAGVLAAVGARLGKRVGAAAFRLNALGEGGALSKRKDEEGEGHLGTLTVALPAQFVGGALVASDGAETASFDFGAAGQGKALAWAFHPRGADYEVRPVDKGTLVSVSYKVFEAK